VAHAFVDGGRESESERPISVGGSGRIHAGIFDPFNYVALGHLHEPQPIARDGVRYSGSLCKYSFSEVSHRKSFSLVELAADGSVKIEEIPISYKRDARIVRGSFAEILKGDALSREDYILAEILDTGAIIDAMGQLRVVYPNILQMRRVSIESLIDPQSTISVNLRQSPRDLFGDFLKYVTSSDPEDADLKAFDEAIGQISTDAPKGEA
jgi:exonuclease SbcD